MSVICEREERIPERPYDPEASCVKCAYNRVRTKFRPTSARMFVGDNGQTRTGPSVPEHFERTCERCGAWWKESVP